MQPRTTKNLLYEQVARIGKATSSAKRLELIEILSQGEKSVEELAAEADISAKLTSAHLKELRLARLVLSRRDGKNIYYRLADTGVADLWVNLRELAEARLVELQAMMQELVAHPDELAAYDGESLLAQAKSGELEVIDVRPTREYDIAHLPYARSIPVPELQRRLREIPRDRQVVAYCRGPFCLMAKEAVGILRDAGISAQRLELGVAEWRRQGLPIEGDEQILTKEV